MSSVWETLSPIDVSKHVEKKNGFSYLSWAWAWTTLKQHYPDASFEVHHSERTELPFYKDPDTKNAYVCVTVTAGKKTATETYPVTDYANKAIENPNASQVNTAIQRCKTKAIGYLGLGCYLYAGEDLPPGPAIAKITKSEDDKEPKEAKGVKMIASVFTEMLPFQKGQSQLEEFWRLNKQAIDILKKEDQHKYEEVLAAFKKRKTEITSEEGEMK